MPDTFYYALAVIIPILAVIIIVICYFKFQYPKDREMEKIRRQKVEEEYEKEPEYAFTPAKVVGSRKYIYTKMDFAMPMLPLLVEEYYATFLLETGEQIEYKISEELFFTLKEGEEGMLVTVNGNFFDFGNGEEIAVEGDGESAQE